MSEATMTLAEADAHVRSATADLQQRLETALQCVSTLRGDIDDLTRKLTEASRERDEAQANYRFMVERAADQRLDGYRELGQRAATAENERDEARAQLATLRAEAAATVEEARRQGREAGRNEAKAAVRLVPLEWLRSAGMQDDASHDRCRAVFITAIEVLPRALDAAGRHVALEEG
jgi:uncharacterized coiled-coil DUF342 family protein